MFYNEVGRQFLIAKIHCCPTRKAILLKNISFYRKLDIILKKKKKKEAIQEKIEKGQ